MRGKGGFVRSSWDEVNELIAAANVYTIKNMRPGSYYWVLPNPCDVDGKLCSWISLPKFDRWRMYEFL